MKIREEYELTGEDLEIAEALREGSLSVIDKMLSDLRKDDEYFIRFYPNEYSMWGNELFRDILGLLEKKEKEGGYPFPFRNNFEKNNIHFYLKKLSSESGYSVLWVRIHDEEDYSDDIGNREKSGGGV